MKTTPKYIVSSETNRSKEGRPDLCWMNIRVEKLDECCKTGEKYYFECQIDGDSYKYFMDGKELRTAFLDNHATIKKSKTGKDAYSFYTNYARGEIYDKLSKSIGKLVCRLQPLAGSDIA